MDNIFERPEHPVDVHYQSLVIRSARQIFEADSRPSAIAPNNRFTRGIKSLPPSGSGSLSPKGRFHIGETESCYRVVISSFREKLFHRTLYSLFLSAMIGGKSTKW